MLKVLKITVVATLFAINAAVANSPLFLGKTQITVESSKENKTLVVQLKEVGSNTVSIAIKDVKGEILETKEVKGNENFVFRYNLDRLPEGIYTLSLTNTTIEYIQPIDVCKNCVNILTERLVQRNKPSFRYANNKLDVNVLNSSQMPVSVIFFNEDGEKIMEDNTTSGIAYGRRFDLSNLIDGTYMIAVKLNDATYYHTVNR